MLSSLRFLQRLSFAVVVGDQERVFVQEAIEVLQYGRAVVVKAVVAPPLQVADLHGYLGEFVSVGVDLDGAKLVNADFRRELEAQHGGKGDDFLFEVQEHLERDIEEVTAAAGGVHDHNLAEFFEEGFDAGAIPRRTLAQFEGGQQGGFEHGPFAAERGHEDGFNDGDDVAAAGVLGA